jgi:hypothetical protein
LGAALLWAGSASAVTIFSDDFESGNLNNWSLSTSSPTTITNVDVGGSQGRVMSFSQGDGSNPDGTATASTSIPDTSGYTNLAVSLQWWADDDNESSSDTLLVQWAVAGSSTWNTIATLSSNGGGFFSTGPLAINTVPSPGTDIQLRFAVNMSQDDERFRVDNVELTGDVAHAPGPIVGAGLPGLLTIGAGLIAFARRRRLLRA